MEYQNQLIGQDSVPSGHHQNGDIRGSGGLVEYDRDVEGDCEMTNEQFSPNNSGSEASAAHYIAV